MLTATERKVFEEFCQKTQDEREYRRKAIRESIAAELDSDEPVDIAGLLDSCKKDGVELSERRRKDYSLVRLKPKDGEPDGYERKWGCHRMGDPIFYGVYLDTPFGFGLLYRGEPNAIVGFDVPDPDVLMVCQLQGTRAKLVDRHRIIGYKHARGLALIDWQKLLVSYAEGFARGHGIKELGIQSGRKNYWTKESYDGEIHISPERALVVYDGAAARLGFGQKADGNWYRVIQ